MRSRFAKVGRRMAASGRPPAAQGAVVDSFASAMPGRTDCPTDGFEDVTGNGGTLADSVFDDSSDHLVLPRVGGTFEAELVGVQCFQSSRFIPI